MEKNLQTENSDASINYILNTLSESYSEITLPILFEKQVEKTPNEIALVFQKKTFTYYELNKRINTLAHYLKDNYDIKQDSLIALCLERNEHMLITILAVLKAGAAYVPIDPKYPLERIQYVLQDAKTYIVLTNESHKKKIENIWIEQHQESDTKSQALTLISIDEISFQKELKKKPETNPVINTKNSDLAYIIYTSGTTGKPKGVMIEHKGVINNAVYAVTEIYDYTQGNKVTAFASYAFDSSIPEFFTTLLRGAELHLLSEETRMDIAAISDYIIAHEINYLYLPPVLLASMPKKQHKSLKAIIYAGESCDPKTASYWSKQCHLYNCYGPTETTVNALYRKIDDGDTKSIGKPILNTTCYILDTQFQLLPPGEVGELFIGGAGVARGYLNREELTKERFISNPFQLDAEKSGGKNSRLYRTGDLVKQSPNGTIEYIGRADFQVKIRGFRIELGEIENALLSFHTSTAKSILNPAIKPRDDIDMSQNDISISLDESPISQSIVIMKERENKTDSTKIKYLVGYYVAPLKLDEEKIFAYLNTKLPDYMVPNFLVHLEKIPLTPNGKIDKNSLPEPKFLSNDTIIAHRNQTEKDICKIWAEVLGLNENQIGIESDFLRLGGDSIIAIQIVSRVRQKLNLHITVKDIFTHKTIERLSDSVLKNKLKTAADIKITTEQGHLTGEVPLLPIQDWFFMKKYKKPQHWNQSFLIKVPQLEESLLKESFVKLISHYDAFRLRYKRNKEGQITQYYHTQNDIENFKFRTFDVRSLDRKEDSAEFNQTLQHLYTEWQSDFDFESGHLASFAYIFGFLDQTARIYCALHHLIVDAVSWRILTQDLQKIYYGEILTSKTSSYRQWCVAINEYAKTIDKEKQYWDEVLSDHDPHALNLFCENEYVQSTSVVSLNQQDTKKLLKECHYSYHTQINDLLLTALTISLSSVLKKSVHHILLEGHGREEIDPSIDISQQLGWFTSMFPVRLEAQENLSETIKFIKEILRKVPNKGIGFGALYGYHTKTIPNITFNYLGQFDQRERMTENQNWSILLESSGLQVHPENQLPSLINVDGSVSGGELNFVITTELNGEKTKSIALSFHKAICDIIEHTSQLKRSYLTPSDIDDIIGQKYLDNLQSSHEIESIYLANSIQQGLVYHALSQGDKDDAYRVQIVIKYENHLNLTAYEEAWRNAQKKYPTLRLRFSWDEKIIQIIDKYSNFNWQFIDLSCDEPHEQDLKIQTLLYNDRLIPFDMSQSGLFRMYLIKKHENSFVCIFTCHHAIMDGWSNVILLQFIHQTYLDIINQKELTFSLDECYGSSQKYLQKHHHDHLDYWIPKLLQIEERSDLSSLLRTEAKHTVISEYKKITHPAEKTLSIHGNSYIELKNFAQTHGITINSILQYAWHKVLHVYGHSAQTVVGTTISGRNLPVDSIENSIGLYINTLPLIVDHSKSLTVVEALQSIQDSIHELNSRGTIHLSDLQKNGVRLFDSMFVYDNYPKLDQNENLFQNKLKISVEDPIEKVDYPLSVIANENNNTIFFTIKYAGELFDSQMIQTLLDVFNTILHNMTLYIDEDVRKLNYLNPSEYKKIVEEWNQTESDYQIEKTIHSVFEKQVSKNPNSIALVYERTQLKFYDLNERANQLAHFIRNRYEILNDILIPICFERNTFAIIGILAVLKSGAAYIPIDPKNPDDRILYIIEDSNPKLILTSTIYQNKLHTLCAKKFTQWAEKNPHILSIDDVLCQNEISKEKKTNLKTTTQPHHLAYALYTSGTTGNPKGVLIEHRSVINLILNQNVFGFQENKKFAELGLASYTFDPFVKECLVSICRGLEVHLLNETTRTNILSVAQYINYQKINYLSLPAALLAELPKQKYPSLRIIMYGGESCEPDAARYFSRNHKLFNCYGPTETTVETTCKQISYDEINIIGKPLKNIKCYVLDEFLNPLPVGAVGELFIAGPVLARGYLNQPELTKEKFIPNPFQTESERKAAKNTKLYKTGDLVRRLPDGNIEYIGRTDFQVKMRGFRIETAEIENVLNQYQCDGIQITKSLVLVKERQSSENKSEKIKYLVGYYISSTQFNEEKIFAYLHTRLPEYMVPSFLVHQHQFKMTSNGKIDRTSLPEPQFKIDDDFIASRNDVEKNITRFFSEILGMSESHISIKSDFFRLGGNSLLSIKLMTKINQFYQSHLNLSDISLCRTVAALTQKVFQKKEQYQKIIPLNHSPGVKNIFMIHPGGSGCEVYVPLADRLKEHYSCYGVDSYNFYNEKKIEDPHELSKYYLNCVDEIMAQAQHDNEYHLLGSSMGGKIALEIASILEKRSVKTINIYLLDTILLLEGMKVPENEKDTIKNYYLEKGYAQSYVEKLMTNFNTEYKFREFKISSNLKHTKILLFKAMRPDTRFEDKSEDFFTEIYNLNYNNVDTVVQDTSQIHVVRLENVSHGAILEHEEDRLVEEIIQFNSKNKELRLGV